MHRDPPTQQAALKVVHGLLRHLAAPELLFLLPAVATLTGHDSAGCRATMYDIFMWVFDNYR